MYKIIKSEGHSQTVYIVNTDTTKRVALGTTSIKLLDILKEDGYVLSKDITEDTTTYKIIPSLYGAWDYEVSLEAKNKLVLLAMPMKKPIRAKVKAEPVIDESKPVCALDVLLGLRSY